MAPQPKFLQTLKGTKTVIIGGATGIGFAVGEHLIEEGASVVIASSNKAKVSHAVARLNDADKQYNADPSRTAGHTVDLSGPQSEASLHALFKQVGPFDHLVITSAVFNPVPLREQTFESIVQTGDVRFAGVILAVKYPPDGWSVLSGFCGAMLSLTRALALELSPKSIRVNCISPGATATEMFHEMSLEVQERLASKVLTGKVGRPEDLAITYVALLKNKNINGTTIDDDGGAYAAKLQAQEEE
ncbi:hypothetical protein OC842_005216 [Tilletia horrida]|uniref:Uncharacterized protein n=1 Tax=Tilletia horrida TaxID=155126 RepID=A0AAN6JJ96_9BASI|nr:hypothetical protein OC842_005216 [Tilletia horrida]